MLQTMNVNMYNFIIVLATMYPHPKCLESSVFAYWYRVICVSFVYRCIMCFI